MANTVVSCPAGEWTKVIDNASGDVSVALCSNQTPVWIQATAADSAPAGTEEGLPLLSVGDGWSEATIAEKFPDPASSVYLWAYPFEGVEKPARISVVHA